MEMDSQWVEWQVLEAQWEETTRPNLLDMVPIVGLELPVNLEIPIKSFQLDHDVLRKVFGVPRIEIRMFKVSPKTVRRRKRARRRHLRSDCRQRDRLWRERKAWDDTIKDWAALLNTRRFANLRSEQFLHLRKLFQDGLLAVPPCDPLDTPWAEGLHWGS